MIAQKLTLVFRETLGLPADVEVTSLRYQEIPEWDSLSHLQLVAGIEKAFGIMLETDDVIDLSSFAKAAEIVAKYEAAQIA